MIIILLDPFSARLPKIRTLIRQFEDAADITVALTVEDINYLHGVGDHIEQVSSAVSEAAVPRWKEDKRKSDTSAGANTKTSSVGGSNAFVGSGKSIGVDKNGRSPTAFESSTKFLSGRQAEVALLVSCGLSNKQIARKLGMSDNTVRAHLKKIFRKLNVKNRTQAAMCINSLRVDGENVMKGSAD